MPFPLHLFNPQSFPRLTPRRVTLVRFVRAVAGFAQIDASDPDDHGFNLDPTFANAHGPAFGICGPDGATPAQQCRIRVMRDRIEPAVQLFPEIVDAGLVSLVTPATGAPLTPGDTITVRAARNPAADTSTTLKLHAGTAAGPVVGECTIRVHPLITIPVKGHSCIINGTQADTDEAAFNTLIANANKILIAAGVKLNLELPLLNTDVVGFTTANAVTLTSSTHWDAEMAKLMRKDPQNGALNVYVVGHIDDLAANGNTSRDDTNGVGISSVFANSNRASGSYVGAQVGFLMRDPDDLEGFAQTLCHELGHVLTLEHYNNKNGSSIHHNNWSMRNLMYNFAYINAGDPMDQIGYGDHLHALPGGAHLSVGMAIGVKKMANLFQSNQAHIMRTAANNGTYLPV